MSPDEIYDNRYKDQIQVDNVIYGIYAGRIIKLAVTFLLIAYFMGLAWIINARFLQELSNDNKEEMFFTMERDFIGYTIVERGV